MLEFPDQNGRPALLIGTVKAVVAIAFLSVFAAHWLSESALDQKSLSQLAAQAARRGKEPTMTGSITRAATAVKLDPCGDSRRP